MQPHITAQRFPVACLAPALTDDTLSRYAALIAGLGPDQAELQDALAALLKCVATWWELPDSTESPVHWAWRGTQRVAQIPLSDALARALWDVTPWMRELDTLSTPRDDGPFDRLPPGELRDMAFHLLWHAKELTLDREPMTRDKLPA